MSTGAIGGRVSYSAFVTHIGFGRSGHMSEQISRSEVNEMEYNRSFPYGAGKTERVIEIPWASSKYNGGQRVLEVGCSFANENPE